jgi:hypothetical protein
MELLELLERLALKGMEEPVAAGVCGELVVLQVIQATMDIQVVDQAAVAAVAAV